MRKDAEGRAFFEERKQDFCEATGLGLEDEPAESEPQHRAISAAAFMQPAVLAPGEVGVIMIIVADASFRTTRDYTIVVALLDVLGYR
jgi:hypothetical protein